MTMGEPNASARRRFSSANPGALVESTEPSQGGAPPDASDHAERCGAVGKIAVRYADANVERLGHRQRCVEGS